MNNRRFSSAVLGFILLVMCCWTLAVPSQVEFTARVQSVETDANGAILQMEFTPDVSKPVRVTAATEIKDENNNSVGLESLRAGVFAKVEAVFTDQGLLALEVKITDSGAELEISGAIEAIADTGGGSRVIQVLGFAIAVAASTEITDMAGDRLFPNDLQVGQFVKVEAMTGGPELVARQVKLRSNAAGFAATSVVGVVSEIHGSEIVVSIEGGVAALVQITPQTKIEGILAVGSSVRVSGVLTPGLAIAALTIQTQSGFRLLPDELRMNFGQTARVDLVLSAASEDDLVFSLISRNPSAAAPGESSATVPAGGLTASFDVTSGMIEARTFIDVQAPQQLGGAARALEVEVENDGPQGDDPANEELEIRWNPRRLQNPATGPGQVELRLNQPAPSDLSVRLFVKDGNPGLASFPDTVTFLEGSTTAGVTIEILATTGETKIRAALPGGGDTDDLEIEFSAQNAERLEIEWTPDDVRLSPNGSAEVRLKLDRPAPADLTVVLSVKDGDASILDGFPSEISFAAGEDQRTVVVQSVGDRGKVRFRAALPFQFGGRDDVLTVEVR